MVEYRRTVVLAALGAVAAVLINHILLVQSERRMTQQIDQRIDVVRRVNAHTDEAVLRIETELRQHYAVTR